MIVSRRMDLFCVALVLQMASSYLRHANNEPTNAGSLRIQSYVRALPRASAIPETEWISSFDARSHEWACRQKLMMKQASDLSYSLVEEAGRPLEGLSVAQAAQVHGLGSGIRQSASKRLRRADLKTLRITDAKHLGHGLGTLPTARTARAQSVSSTSSDILTSSGQAHQALRCHDRDRRNQRHQRDRIGILCSFIDGMRASPLSTDSSLSG